MLPPNRAPKGRTTLAQANGLGPRTLPVSLQALKGRNSTLGGRRGPRVVLITPPQGLQPKIGQRSRLRPLAWALLGRLFGAKGAHSRCPAENG